jgi:hypothetical protein
VAEKNTRWENDKEWAGWTIRDEVYDYVRKHWLPTIVSTTITIAGSVWAFIQSHPTLGASVGAVALTITAIAILALIDGRKRRSVPSSVKSNAVDGPKALVCGVCEGQRVFLLVTNEGSSAEFYGLFDVEGQVTTSRQTNLFCRWEHTDSPRTRIAKGQTCRIYLARLRSDSGFHQWRIEATSDTGPFDFDALYTSSSISQPVSYAPDIMVIGSIIADPDLANGLQRFKVVLKAFTAEILNENSN